MSHNPSVKLEGGSDPQWQEKMNDLTDELLMAKGMLASLRDTPRGREEETLMTETRDKIKRLSAEIVALRAQRSKSQASMASFLPSRSGAGPSNGLPSRKRDPEAAGLSVNSECKSRRTTPNGSSPPRRPFDLGSESAVIDLTGDDQDFRDTIAQLKQREERLRQEKLRTDQDAAFARQMQGNGSSTPPHSHRPLSSQPGSSSQPVRNVFDRMVSRSIQNESRLQPQSARRRIPSPVDAEDLLLPSERATNNSGPDNRVPGAYLDSDGDSDVEMLGSRSLLNHKGTYHGLPSPRFGRASLGVPSVPAWALDPPGPELPFNAAGTSSANSLAYTPNVPAAELARQAALTRQGFGSASSYNAASSMSLPSYLTNPFRPGQLANGHYDFLGTASSSLQGLINRTNQFDWMNMQDDVGNPLNPYLASYIDDYVHDPRKTQAEIQDLLSNIRPDMEIEKEDRGETPEALRYPLYVHQHLALKWMASMEEGSNKGGILADDMGLGKTISTLALMATRMSPETTKTNLIIGPVALIRQWETEIKKKLKPDYRFSVFLLHGKKTAFSDLRRYDVVLTTFGSVASELKRYETHVAVRQGASEYNPADDTELHAKCPLLHPKSKFFRVILDEAQCIKNKDTQAARGTNYIQATYRWCLTGTPMMNGVHELFPLIRFLRIKPYNEQKRFNTTFGSLSAKKSSNNQRSTAMTQLQVLLKAIMLRRMKTSEIDGKPIVELPEKKEHVEHVVFSDEEGKYYKDLETQSQVKFNKYLRAGTVGKNYSNILVLLLRLRQACCHPHLNLDFEIANNNEVPEDDMVALAKSLDDKVVSRLKDIEAFECPICFDPVPDPTLIIPCGHDTCSECFANVITQAEQNNLQNGQEGGNARCPHCRGALNAQKIITYSVFQKVHMPDKFAAANSGDGDGAARVTELTDDETASETESSDDDDDDNDGADLRDFIVADDEVEDEDEDIYQPKTRKKRAKSKKTKGKMKAKEVTPNELKTLRKEASKNKEARSRYMRYLRKNWEDSAKISKTTQLLETIQATDEKTIVFSQWTSLLDLLEIPLKYELGIKYCRYDGGMSRDQRAKSVTDFTDDPHVKVLLVSLRAGNAGLNLTVASRIIILDPFWNPFIEMQAVDRAHRIGQQRNVQVHRILVEGTVEDRIVELQEKKRELINTALDEGDAKSLSRLSLQELGHLFGVQ